MATLLRWAALVAVIIHVQAAASVDHYRALGVPHDASADAIKASYRKIALTHHPDKLKRDASADTRRKSKRIFEDANAAFECLSDPSQRRQYDFDLANPIQQGADGVYKQGGMDGAPAQRRPIVKVEVACTLR